ncbi:MAG: putative metal-binding motif-containing protein [Nanoarchaeota archaeon]
MKRKDFKIFFFSIIFFLILTGVIYTQEISGKSIFSIFDSHATVTRSFSNSELKSGDELTVFLNVKISSEYYYVIEEDIPNGMIVLDSGAGNISVIHGQQKIRWVKIEDKDLKGISPVFVFPLKDEELTYKVRPSSEGQYVFSGSYISEDMDKNQSIEGETNVKFFSTNYEICNGIDDNQDGLIDENCDDDNDDYCDINILKTIPYNCKDYNFCCNLGIDCDDSDEEIHPGIKENCFDKIDNDCDNLIDFNDPDCLEECVPYTLEELPNCITSACENKETKFKFNDSACNDFNECTIDKCKKTGCEYIFISNSLCAKESENCTDSDYDGFLDYSLNCNIGKDKCIGNDIENGNELKPKFKNINISWNNSSNNYSLLSGVKIFKPGFSEIEFIGSLKLIKLNESGCYDSVNLDPLVEISDKKINISSSEFLELNKSAKIIFYNVLYVNPKILKNGIECFEPDCRIIAYNLSEHSLNIEVQGFSEYKVVEGYSESSESGGSSGGGGGGPSGKISKYNATINSSTNSTNENQNIFSENDVRKEGRQIEYVSIFNIDKEKKEAVSVLVFLLLDLISLIALSILLIRVLSNEKKQIETKEK